MRDDVASPDGSGLSEGLGPLRSAADEVMAHQWSNNREAMDALTRLVDAAHAAEPREGENKVLRELIALAIPVLETIEPECDSERVEMFNLLSRLKNAVYAEEREQQISLLGAEKEPCRFPSCQFVGCPAGGCYGSRP